MFVAVVALALLVGIVFAMIFLVVRRRELRLRGIALVFTELALFIAFFLVVSAAGVIGWS